VKVLLVDDDPKFRRYMTEGLRASGLECDAAADGREALALLEAARGPGYDIVLLDVMLPEQSGWEVLQDARRLRPELPVVFVTARDAVDERVRGLRLGADDYVVKPFAFPELLARLEVVTRRRKEADPIVLGALRIEPLRRRVWLGERLIELSPREFDLLVVLARRPGEAFTRAELLREVWNIDFDPQTNVVDVHVARLRRRLGGPTEAMVRTVRNRGYALRAPVEAG
jgi:two-component system copper resistance phosphate regulon response regulator CusR